MSVEKEIEEGGEKDGVANRKEIKKMVETDHTEEKLLRPPNNKPQII